MLSETPAKDVLKKAFIHGLSALNLTQLTSPQRFQIATYMRS